MDSEVDGGCVVLDFACSLNKTGTFAGYGSCSLSSRIFDGVLAGIEAGITLKQ